MNWLFYQPSRAEHERAEIAALEERAPWLTGVKFRIAPGLQLAGDFAILLGEDELAFQIVYPDFFPDVPPAVIPKNPERISGHQWGAGGELCLEYRADNWSPHVTGAMLIESAYRLLAGEGPDAEAAVPSAHSLIVGQEVRNVTSRFLLTPAARSALLTARSEAPLDLKLVDLWFDDGWFAQPTEVSRGADVILVEPAFYRDEIPFLREGKVLRLRDDQRMPTALTLDAIVTLAKGGPLEEWAQGWTGERVLSLALVKGSKIRLFMLVSKDGRALAYQAVDIPPAGQRVSDLHAGLAGKKVGVVGCGSIGSKVAVSLARAGVGAFVLIDADLFYPGNVVRNDLDLRAVGANKAKAVRRAISSVKADAEVTVRNILLGGQESSNATGAAMQLLAACDLIVDATADPAVFNLCGLVSRNEKRAMAWGQVFAGGVGGLVARARPDLDPPPKLAHAQIRAWYAERGVPWLEGEGNNYELRTADQPPMIADDADVTVIAAHLTRLVIDTLIRPAESIFPASAYCIGLTQGWIFDAPFDTWPIGYSAEGAWGPQVEDAAAERGVAFIVGLLPPKDDDGEG